MHKNLNYNAFKGKYSYIHGKAPIFDTFERNFTCQCDIPQNVWDQKKVLSQSSQFVPFPKTVDHLIASSCS